VIPGPDSLRYLIEYLLEPSTWVAVLIPAAIAFELWRATAWQPGRQIALQQFLLGTTLSVVFSFWRETDGMIALYMLPGYSVVLFFASAASRPSPPRAYVLCFLSLLTADLWCAAKRAIELHGKLTADFYRGVGGAGLFDSLLIVPAATAICLAIYNRLTRSAPVHERAI